jgi:hypothetical protein
VYSYQERIRSLNSPPLQIRTPAVCAPHYLSHHRPVPTNSSKPALGHGSIFRRASTELPCATGCNTRIIISWTVAVSTIIAAFACTSRHCLLDPSKPHHHKPACSRLAEAARNTSLTQHERQRRRRPPHFSSVNIPSWLVDTSTNCLTCQAEAAHGHSKSCSFSESGSYPTQVRILSHAKYILKPAASECTTPPLLKRNGPRKHVFGGWGEPEYPTSKSTPRVSSLRIERRRRSRRPPSAGCVHATQSGARLPGTA